MATVDGINATKERRVKEFELLTAMYPELQWNEQRQELKYTAEGSASLLLRVPDDYPGTSHPILISAFHKDKTDLRDLTKGKIDEMGLPLDEEIIDAIIQAFEEILQMHSKNANRLEDGGIKTKNISEPKYKTVIIWLHHLLNTNKRKLASNPTSDPEQITGVTKPGYPGVLVYSGNVTAIDDHVAELKSQRWQAFQVRFEESMSTPWSFTHLPGIREVESMSEVVQEILDTKDQETFLKAVGVR
ncbi:hypothetical protein H2198_004975 [Neophaeococcomyces mojaviensis]|uniref:Uncharacterized protein n=1 Tax=Neophaeococcomyces mojaviensis TaxID=3383035 RepID=A0ACC3A7A3_9EURO|nr:hypothetical protein H2198_004975 [Knufia sp. JES_112]